MVDSAAEPSADPIIIDRNKGHDGSISSQIRGIFGVYRERRSREVRVDLDWATDAALDRLRVAYGVRKSEAVEIALSSLFASMSPREIADLARQRRSQR